jgi:hypothetical protein
MQEDSPENESESELLRHNKPNMEMPDLKIERIIEKSINLGGLDLKREMEKLQAKSDI